MLRIIRGRISSGKTHAIIDEIGKRIENSLPSVLIVPDRVTYNFEQRLCRQNNINGFIDAQVYSFNRFAQNVISYCGKGRKTFLDDCTRLMALRRCISEVSDGFLVFKNASKRKGFTKRCLNMISTLENCGYSYADLISVTEKLPDGMLKYKLHDTALIFDKYSALLEKGYTDNSDRLACARALLPEYEPIKNAVVYIDGFDVFTSRLYSFIGGLIKECDVVIALSSACDRNDREAYEIHETTLKKIIALAKDENVDYKTEYSGNTDNEKSEEIRFIENNFYSVSPEKYNGKAENVSLDYFQSPEDEVYFVARDIAKKVREGARYRDFAVLSGDTEKYSPIVNNVFSRLEIPVYTGKKHDIASHPVALYLFSLFSCITSGFPPEAVCDLLLSSLTGFTRDECDRFISFIREAGIRGSEIERGLAFKRGSEEKQADFAVLRERLVEPIKEFKVRLNSAKTAREMSGICYDFLTEQGIYGRIDSLVDKYENMGEYSLSDVSSQLWNTAIKLLEDVADIFEDDCLTVSEFAETLREGFTSTLISTIPSVLDSVTFGSLEAAREQGVTDTYVIGANDGIIPAIFNDERLVTVKEGEILAEKGFELAHSAGTEDARMRYNMYSAFCSPKTRLTVSCPIFSSSGSPLAPSYVFSRFENLFPKNKPVSHRPLTNGEILENPYTKDELILAAAKDKIVSERSKAIFEDSADDFDTIRFIKEKSESIPPEITKLLYSSTLSVSRLESFAQCPLAHFIECGLKPEEIKDYSFNQLDMGNVFHSTLERFVKETAKNKDMDREECAGVTEKIFDEETEKVHFGAMTATSRQRAFNKLLKNIAAECAWKVKNQLASFEPIGTEIQFGRENIPPIEVETDYGSLYLTGKIDRADKAEKDGDTYIRIVDYKTGKVDFNKDREKHLQLAVYMNALLNAEKARPAEAFYMLLSDGNVKLSGIYSTDFESESELGKNSGKSEESFIEYLNSVNETVCALANDMFSGNIKADSEKGGCRYCTFAPVCGKRAKKGDEEDE